jgi:hypothetical protein
MTIEELRSLQIAPSVFRVVDRETGTALDLPAGRCIDIEASATEGSSVVWDGVSLVSGECLFLAVAPGRKFLGLHYFSRQLSIETVAAKAQEAES